MYSAIFRPMLELTMVAGTRAVEARSLISSRAMMVPDPLFLTILQSAAEFPRHNTILPFTLLGESASTSQMLQCNHTHVPFYVSNYIRFEVLNLVYLSFWWLINYFLGNRMK